MKMISASAARENLDKLLEQDWRVVQETLYLLSIPKMRESIRRGMKTPIRKLSAKPPIGW